MKTPDKGERKDTGGGLAGFFLSPLVTQHLSLFTAPAPVGLCTDLPRLVAIWDERV